MIHLNRGLTLLSLLLVLGLISPSFNSAHAQLDGGINEDIEEQEQAEIDNDEEDDYSISNEMREQEVPPPPAQTTTPAPSAPSQTRPSDNGVIFDWSKHEGATEVPHPFAEKGLLRIDKNRTYIYRVDESEQKTAAAVRFGSYHPQNLESNAGDGGVTTTFDDNYDQTDTPAILVDWEWQLWKSPIGKFGITAGAGVYVAQGNGHFVGANGSPSVNTGNGLKPEEIFTLAVIPFSAGAVYRMQLWHKQLLVPYAAGGGILFGMTEFRDDDKAPKFGGSYGAYYAAGGALDLTYFDKMSRIQLDREYGINAIYLTVEYRNVVALSSTFDFSGDLMNAGFLMEY